MGGIVLDFVAIDFETATSNYTSVCSLGICVVEDNEIKDRIEILIKPDPFEFNDYNIKIHGIKPEMVYNKPTFDEYWPKIKPYLDGKTVITLTLMSACCVRRWSILTYRALPLNIYVP